MPEKPLAGVADTAISVRFTDMAYGGDAVGKDPMSGVAVFGWPGIEGEESQIVVRARRNNLVRGRVTSVAEPSPLRTSPPCPYFGECGGCQWQHIQAVGQLQFKQAILLSQLSRIGGIADPTAIIKRPLASPRDFNYRNTSHFAIDPQARSLGYFRRDSHSVLAVETCPISNAGINRVIPVVNSMLSDAPGEEYLRDETRGLMQVWKVTVRSSEVTGQTLVILHSRAGGRAKPRHAERHGRRGGDRGRPEEGPSGEPSPASSPGIHMVRREVRRAVSSLFQSQEGEEPLPMTVIEVMDDGTINKLGETRSSKSLLADAAAEALEGSSLKESLARSPGASSGPPAGAWMERLGGRHYWIAPEAFFQVNTGAAELLLAEVAEHVPRRVSLLVDAHAGVGTFALAFASSAERIIAFEPDGSAVTSGRWTATANNIGNVEFRQGRAEALMSRLHPSECPDLVILDPPRAGCHPELLAEIVRREVARIIYVSCDPSTLARDIKALAPTYSLKSARLLDMFPQTYHLETVAVLECEGPR